MPRYNLRVLTCPSLLVRLTDGPNSRIFTIMAAAGTNAVTWYKTT